MTEEESLNESASSDNQLGRQRSKSQRRIDVILTRIPGVREQLLVAMEDINPSFDFASFANANNSSDPRERNKVGVIERMFEELVNWIDELAERALAEARRKNLIPKQSQSPFNQLVEHNVISSGLAQRLREAKQLRDLLQHGYPLGNLKVVHEIIVALPQDLKRFLEGFCRWRDELDL